MATRSLAACESFAPGILVGSAILLVPLECRSSCYANDVSGLTVIHIVVVCSRCKDRVNLMEMYRVSSYIGRILGVV